MGFDPDHFGCVGFEDCLISWSLSCSFLGRESFGSVDERIYLLLTGCISNASQVTSRYGPFILNGVSR